MVFGKLDLDSIAVQGYSLGGPLILTLILALTRTIILTALTLTLILTSILALT